MIKFKDVKDMSTKEYFNGNQFSVDAFNQKYRLHDDEKYVDAVWRVCKEIASVEVTPELRKLWAERWFDEVFDNWWHPAGSIMQGAGSGRKISLANCTTVSLGTNRDGEEWDNLESIIRNTGYTTAKTAAYRQGLGIDFSRLRPRGSKVLNSANESEGSIHWMGFIDSLGYKVGQKGRIPAMLFSLNINHPDIEEFIQLKKDYTVIQNANISVQITDDFYKAVKDGEDWDLIFEVPSATKGDKIYIDEHSSLKNSLVDEITGKHYYLATHNKHAETISKRVKAKKLFKLIAENMWKNGEPGIQNIDVARRFSNSDAVYRPGDSYDSRIVSTNACSEQYLSRDSLCVLASIFIGRFAVEPSKYKVELSEISESINRFLDNVNEYELRHKTFATPDQETSIRKLRRTGAGVTDIGGWLFKQNMEYGSDEGNATVEKFAKWYNYYLYESTIALGHEKGSFEMFDPKKIHRSKFIQRMDETFPDMKFDAMRNVTVSSIAPTGTLSLMSSHSIMSYGVEPAFGMYYWKRTRMSGNTYKYYFVVPTVVREKFEEKGLRLPMKADTIEDTWDGKRGKPVVEFIEEHKASLDLHFKQATEVDPLDKMKMMAGVMKWVDSSISVTYLLPEDTKIGMVEKFIMQGWETGVKSIAAFPDRKMYGIVSFVPFKDLATGLKSEGVSISPQNFSEKEMEELSMHNEHISYSTAPKRPKTLDADIYTITVKGEKFIVVVGLMNGAPYEVFAGSMNGLSFKFKERSGKIEKVRRSVYRLIIGEDIEITNFSEHFKPVEKSLFRMVSTNLRHGVPIKYIVEQLGKSMEELNTLTSAAARVLKKYIHDGEIVSGMSCPNGHTDLIYEEGCVKCVVCGWSKCE